MLDDAADVVQRDVRQTAVLVSGEQRLAVLLQRLMHMHAVAVVADDGFRHESQGFSVSMSDVLQRVFQDLHFVGFFGQRVRRDIDLALAGGRHFMMMNFEFQTHFFASHRHRGANVLLRIHRGNRKVAALHARPMRAVAFLICLAGIPRAFVRIDFVGAAVHAGTDRDVVENEELVFRSEQRRVGDAGSFQMRFGAFRQGARIASVALHGHRLDDIAAQIQRGFFVKRINDRRRRDPASKSCPTR